MFRKSKARAQWPSALLFLAGSLRAGLSLDQALTCLCEEIPEPLKTVLAGRVVGGPVEARVRALFAEVDLSLARAALLLTHKTGGEAALLLERASRTLQQKIEMEDRARALSAQGRMSAWMVGLTPFGILAAFAVVSPDYAAPLFTTAAGLSTLAVVVCMLAAGLVLVQKMVKVEP